MKEWIKPDFIELGAQYTEAGGNGGQGDGVHYQVDFNGKTVDLIGTSGPPI